MIFFYKIGSLKKKKKKKTLSHTRSSCDETSCHY